MTIAALPPDVAQRAAHMRRLLYGQLLSRALCAIADLRIPDLLGDGGRTAEDLARSSGAHAGALRAVLRALTVFDVFAERDGRFHLTPLGAVLRADAPGSALATALLAHNEIGQAWQDLATTVRTGQPAFAARFGLDFFAYLDRNPETRRVFDQSQASGVEVDEFLGAVDFSGHRLVVDVGGGDGVLLTRVLTAHPHLRGVLLDLPSAAVNARDRLAAAGLADRCEVVEGDFFTAVPAGGDLYVLRQVLHDWDDERCVDLLRACRRAMPDDARLVVVDLVARWHGDAEPTDELTALMDLYMLTVVDGRERTREEFADLLGRAGFAVRDVAVLSGGTAAITAEPTRRADVPPTARRLMRSDRVGP